MVNQSDKKQIRLTHRSVVGDSPAAIAKAHLIDVCQDPSALDHLVARVEPAGRDEPGSPVAQQQVPCACEHSAPIRFGERLTIDCVDERESASHPTGFLEAQLTTSGQMNVNVFAEPPAAELAPWASVELEDVMVRPATGRKRFERHRSQIRWSRSASSDALRIRLNLVRTKVFEGMGAARNPT